MVVQSVCTASSDLGERVASEEEKDADNLTEQKLRGEQHGIRQADKIGEIGGSTDRIVLSAVVDAYAFGPAK